MAAFQRQGAAGSREILSSSGTAPSSPSRRVLGPGTSASRGKATPVRIVVPGRTAVEEYDILKGGIERRTGKIDGAFTDVGRVPIRYIRRSLNGEELTACRRACTMDPGEIRRRMRRLRRSVRRHGIHSRVNRFLLAGISDDPKDFPQMEFFIPRESEIHYGGAG